MNIVSLCSGIGGIDLGLHLAIPSSRVILYVEREVPAAAILAAHIEAGNLSAAPIWSDLATLPLELLRGRTDMVCAGFPCQPASVAGKRAGISDERWIWKDIARILRDLRPPLVFLENVPGLLTVSEGAGFAQVLRTLAEVGLNAEWDCFSVRALGGSHKRERLFILGYSAGFIWRQNCSTWDISNWDNSRWKEEDNRLGEPSEGLADPDSSGFSFGTLELNGEKCASPQRSGYNGMGPANRLHPPKPNDPEWANIRQDHWPTKPSVRGLANGAPSRTDQLRVLGNGAHPLAVAVAFRTLLNRAYENSLT